MKYVFLLLSLSVIAPSAYACEMIMGYRTTHRPPFIRGAPDNEGLYKAIYEVATSRIGCQLRIVRSSKNRIMAKLKSGLIDFYPGLIVTHERASFLHFISNGLPDGNVGLSRRDFPDIQHPKDLKGYVVLRAKGGPVIVKPEWGAVIKEPPEMSVALAAEMIKANKADFYIYNFLSLTRHLNETQDHTLRIQRCCGELHPMALGFSTRSRHIQLKTNPDYNPALPANISNSMYQLDGESAAAKLALALQSMQKDGTINRLFTQYFGKPMPVL